MHFDRNLSRRSAITAATAAVGSAFLVAPAVAHTAPDQLPLDPELPVDPGLATDACRLLSLELAFRGLALVASDGTDIPVHDLYASAAVLIETDLELPRGGHSVESSELGAFNLLGFSPRGFRFASDPLAPSDAAAQEQGAVRRSRPGKLNLDDGEHRATEQARPRPRPRSYHAEFAYAADEARTESGIVTLTSAEAVQIDLEAIVEVALTAGIDAEIEFAQFIGDLALVADSGETYTLASGSANPG
ncbi:hypothetical protein [Glycomyces sp. NRRL B-16210]|uniref:hypothetical protein n=1 Tax=Glycomyces sp. NRRL B-16210 TaxID=1463821 RepID=UPI0004BF515F|nr:hypothetical protein [Glycomyces sp. NRRL B-16210]